MGFLELIRSFPINKLAKVWKVDRSYVSRIRSGERVPQFMVKEMILGLEEISGIGRETIIKMLVEHIIKKYNPATPKRNGNFVRDPSLLKLRRKKVKPFPHVKHPIVTDIYNTFLQTNISWQEMHQLFPSFSTLIRGKTFVPTWKTMRVLEKLFDKPDGYFIRKFIEYELKGGES